MKLQAEWTDDCQGKKDYDADLVRLSTRYWPRGGSFLLLNRDAGTMTDGSDPTRQTTIPPSAHATIYLGTYPLLASETDIGVILAEHEFTAETEVEVKAQVEAWAQAQYDRIVTTLLHEFKPHD